MFRTTNRGKRILQKGGYEYHLNKRNGDQRSYLRCVEYPECNGTCVYDERAGSAIERKEHSHLPNPEKIKIKMVAEMKGRAEEDNNFQPIQIYRDTLVNATTEGVAPLFLTYDAIGTTLHRRIRKKLPSCSGLAGDLEIPPSYAITRSGLPFLTVDKHYIGANNQTKRTLVFCSKACLEFFAASPTWAVDGTFDSCRRQFAQVFIIRGFVHGVQFPLVYALLENNDTTTYMQLILNLKELAAQYGLCLNPAQIMSDFESAVLSSFQSQFQSAMFSGCWFHYRSARRKFIQNKGFSCAYRDDQGLRKFFRAIVSLPFLLASRIQPFFSSYIASFSKKQIGNCSTQFSRQFIRTLKTYYGKTWLPRVEQLSIFFSSIRTKNGYESFHSKMNRIIGKTQPNIYKLLDFLIDEETCVVGKAIQLNHGGRHPSCKRKYKDLDDSYSKLKESYSDGEISELDYIDKIALLVAEFE